jgi:hypothetical protein
MLSRRDVMAKLAAGTAAACVVGVAGSSLASTGPEGSTPTGSESPTGAPDQPYHAVPIVDAATPETLSVPPRWELLSPLTVGSELAEGWRVAAMTGVAAGSCVLTLENRRGRTHRVHLCRNDGRPQGMVYTKQFDLVVMNGGFGDLPTEEGFAQAVADVAHVLAANESRSDLEPVITALLPHAERLDRFGNAARLR